VEGLEVGVLCGVEGVGLRYRCRFLLGVANPPERVLGERDGPASPPPLEVPLLGEALQERRPSDVHDVLHTHAPVVPLQLTRRVVPTLAHLLLQPDFVAPLLCRV